MNNEIKSILKMVESGKITSEEGEQLINSLNTSPVVPSNTNSASTHKKFIHIEVYSTEDGETKVKVNIPLGLAKTVLKMGNIKEQISLHAPDIDLNLDSIIEAIEDNSAGELINIESGDTKVRVWVD